MTARPCEERVFVTHDDVKLFYRYWPATAPRAGAVVLLHRGHEHSGRMAHLVDELDLPSLDFVAWDARGHGRSPGARGDSPSFGTSVRDLQTFVRHVHDAHGVPVEDVAVLAQSVGAVVAAAWVHDYAPPIRAQVLASPALSVKLYVPFARQGLGLMRRLRGNFFVTSYVKPRLLTRDPARQATYATDPLIARAISVNILLGLHATAQRLIADAQAIIAPTQLLVSGADWVVRLAPQHRFFERLGSAVKEKHVFPQMLHDTLGDCGRDEAVRRARDFLLRAFAATPTAPDLRGADRRGHTLAEAQRISAPLPRLSPRGLYWATSRATIRLGSVLSEGMRIGRSEGFNSGSALDYVYRNCPAGIGILGRLADRHYLDAIGWRGIRQRKLHVEELLRLAMDRLAAARLPVHVLDVAAGHGRYVLDAFAAQPRRPDSILLRDADARNVRKGTLLFAERGLGAITTFERADAFASASYANLAPAPTLAVVSGLYELFPDNAPVRDSLAGHAQAIANGGYLVYTCQPWHPQLELIARTLTGINGGAWVMRRRTQAEMDQLVSAAGFTKVDQRIDEWGMFTVSLARRVAR